MISHIIQIAVLAHIATHNYKTNKGGKVSAHRLNIT